MDTLLYVIGILVVILIFVLAKSIIKLNEIEITLRRIKFVSDAIYSWCVGLQSDLTRMAKEVYGDTDVSNSYFGEIETMRQEYKKDQAWACSYCGAINTHGGHCSGCGAIAPWLDVWKGK